MGSARCKTRVNGITSSQICKHLVTELLTVKSSNQSQVLFVVELSLWVTRISSTTSARSSNTISKLNSAKNSPPTSVATIINTIAHSAANCGLPAPMWRATASTVRRRTAVGLRKVDWSTTDCISSEPCAAAEHLFESDTYLYVRVQFSKTAQNNRRITPGPNRTAQVSRVGISQTDAQ